MRYSRLLLLCAACMLAGASARAGTVLTFEGLDDLQFVDNFYSGVTFNNAVALVAGFDLNDAEFPPLSGLTVATPAHAPLSIVFDAPITDFQAAFTHSDTLTLLFFLGPDQVGSVSSTFTNNLALSGDEGSSPNEILSFHNDLTFNSVQFSGGGIFVLDDVAFNAAPGSTSDAPEPVGVGLAGIGLVALCIARRRR